MPVAQPENISATSIRQNPASRALPWVTIAGGWPSKCNEAVAYLSKHGIRAGCSGSLSYGLEVSARDSIKALHLLRTKHPNSRKFLIFTHPVVADAVYRPEVRALHSLLDAHIKKGMSKKRVIHALKRCGLVVWHGPSDWGLSDDVLCARHHNQTRDEWRLRAEFGFDPSGRFMYYCVVSYYYPKQTASRTGR